MHYRGHGVLQVAVFIILNLDQKKFTYIDTPFNWLYPAESFSSNWYKFPQLAQKIPPTSFNPIVRYRIHKGPWHVLILSQINLVYYHAIDPQTFQVASFTQVSPPIFCTGSSPPPTPIPASFHPTLKFLHLNSRFTFGEEYKVTTLLTVQIS